MRASPSSAPSKRYQGGSCPPVAAVGRRAPSPAKPLLPLLVQRADAVGGVGAVSTARGGGLLAIIERGELPPGCDLEPTLTSDGPMRAVRAPLHAAAADRRQRRPVMTETSGFKQMHDFKLDFGEIEKLPAKLNVVELRKWEGDEAAEKALLRGLQQGPGGSSDSRSHAASSTAAPLVGSASPPAFDRDDPQTYTELLDLYSMHEFIIRKGKTLRSTPEFASFKRHYAAAWGGIESVIAALEELLAAHGVDLAYIDGKKLAALASYSLGRNAAVDDLVECIANADEVEPLLGDVAHQYQHGQRGHQLAAAKIQSVWRMYRQFIAYKHLLLGTRAATIIQRQWAIHRAHCATRRTIQAVRQTRVLRWRQTMAQFSERWPRIRQGRRTVIHVPSLSYPPSHTKKVPFYMAQQLGQLTRLCDLADPKVEVVLIAPFKPEPEVLEYYHSLLEEAGVANAKGRLTLLVPEEAQRLPDGMSLTRLVLMSTRLMKMLRAISTGKPAFLVPGVTGPEELLLAAELNVPLLGPEPHVAQVFGTKSGCHRLMEAADVPTPIGARNIRTRKDLLRALTSLMLTHRDCPRWLVKLETEAGSRGHAYFDVGRMKTLKNVALVQKTNAVPAATSSSAGGNASTNERSDDLTTAAPEVFDMLLKELEEHGAKRVRLVHQAAYADWAAYLDMLDVVGACVEAVPVKPLGAVTANLFVEPSGEVQLHSLVEPLLAPAYTVMGSCCPPTIQFPRDLVEDAAVRVAKAARRKRIMGYLSVDFVLFAGRSGEVAEGRRSSVRRSLVPRADRASDGMAAADGDLAGSADPDVQFWGVDVDLCWMNNAVAFHFATMLSSAHRSGGEEGRQLRPDCFIQPNSLPVPVPVPMPSSSTPAAAGVQYVYSGLIYNPFISCIRHTSFFSLCHARGISFDREQQSGIVFHLVDVLLRGCLGVLSLGPDMSRNVRRMAAFQSLMNMELPKQGEHSAESNFAYFSAVVRQLARIVSPKVGA